MLQSNWLSSHYGASRLHARMKLYKLGLADVSNCNTAEAVSPDKVSECLQPIVDVHDLPGCKLDTCFSEW